MASSSPPPLAIEWAVAGSAVDGDASGDLHCVIPGPNRVVVGAIDGLGHGRDAAYAASECALILQAHADEPLVDLVRRCHEGLRATRGVALTLSEIDVEENRLSWLAVGNVEGLVLRRGLARGPTHAAVLQRGGVVGYRLPSLALSHVDLCEQDLIVLATDGIKSGFANDLNVGSGVQHIADHICQRFARGSDDTLALVVRYVGRAR